MKEKLQKLVKSWEQLEELVSQEIETGTETNSRKFRELHLIERDTLRQCLRELKEVLGKEMSNVS